MSGAGRATRGRRGPPSRENDVAEHIPTPADSAGTDARPIFGAMKLRKCEQKQGFLVFASLSCTTDGAT